MNSHADPGSGTAAQSRPHSGAGFSREDFIQRFASYWASQGGSLAEGQIAAFLLLDENDGATAAQIAQSLGLSRGAVSQHTRALVHAGFVRRYRKPGQRADYHVMDADVWGGFLQQHQKYLESQHMLAAQALETVSPGTAAHQRLQHMRDYMGWLSYDVQLPRRWQEFKSQRQMD